MKMNDKSIPKTIYVIGTKYDGSPRDEWPAQLIQVQGTQLCIHVPAGVEEIVQGYRRQIITDSYHGLYWTDRWYNVWRLDRTEGVRFYANVAMPCQFDGHILRWVDLDLDIVQYTDGSTVLKDQQEFEERSLRLAYPREVIDRALAVRDELLDLANAGAFPFTQWDEAVLARMTGP